MFRTTKRHRRTLGIGIAVAAVSAGGAAAYAVSANPDVPEFTTLSPAQPGATPAIGESAATSQLASLSARLDKSSVSSSSIAPPRLDYGAGYFVQTKVTATGPANAKGQQGVFESALLAADLAAEATGSTRGKPSGAVGQTLRDAVAGALVHVTYADGTTEDTVTGGMVTDAGPYTDMSDEDVRTDVQTAAAANGFTVDDVRVLHLLDNAVEVTVSTPEIPKVADLDKDLGSMLAQLQAPKSEGIYEGVLITVVYKGEPMAYAYVAPRAGMGGHWYSKVIAPFQGGSLVPPR